MKTLIIYASKYGTTEDCAFELKNQIKGETKLINMKENSKTVDIDEFDNIIIGCSIYMTRISLEIFNFCEQNLQKLLDKKVGIFLCCGFLEQFQEYLNQNFPKELLENAVISQHFGAEARVSKMKFITKCMFRALTKGNHANYVLLPDNIEAFAAEFK